MADPDRDRWSATVVLADGETAFMRPITPDDKTALRDFHARQSREAQYRRFFSAKPRLTDAELAHFTEVDFRDRVALVLEIHGEFAAWASYERWTGRDDADVAFMVDGQHQGKGIAALLLEHLAVIARSNGITRFTAETLMDNRAMLAVFTKAGWPVQRHFESGIVDIEFPLEDTEQFVDSVEAREHRADSRAMARLLLPRSIAVVGASDTPGTVGAELWRNVARCDIPIYAVNPRRTDIGGVPCHARVSDIGQDVWLAVIAVPAAELPAVVDDCIAARVRGAVIITALDDTDDEMLAGLVDRARRNGLRLIGPASMGVAASRQGGGEGERPGLDASLAPFRLRPGHVAISLQSGSLGTALLEAATRLQLGLSWFVSLGDKCDVSGNDLMQFWEDDADTRVIALYTETFGNPRKFARIARRVSLRRPIVAVRVGAAADTRSVDALYEHAGLIQVATVAELLDTTRVLVDQPVPRGPRVAVVTNSRSPGVLAAASLRTAGLDVVDPLPDELHLDWRSHPRDVERAVLAAMTAPDIDAVMVIHAPPLAGSPPPAAEIDAAAARARRLGSTTPIVAVLLGGTDGPVVDGSPVPSFSFPEPAAAVLGRMHDYGRWLASETSSTDDDLDGIDAGRADESRLEAYGIATVPAVVLNDASPDQIAAAAASVGFPVAVKAGKRRVGRSTAAGIALDLTDRSAVVDAVQAMRDALGDDARDVTVQQMVPPGADIRVCCVNDPALGVVVSVGVGGVQAPLFDDELRRLAPLSHAAAERLVDASRARAALETLGTPDEVAAARTHLVDLVRRLARLAADHPQIDLIDANPVIVTPMGCHLTDIRLESTDRAPDDAAIRRL